MARKLFFLNIFHCVKCLLIAGAVLTTLSGGTANCEPWDDLQDTALAVSRPDEYAWRLFVSMNWPADVTKRTANASVKFGADGPVVWETWKLARDVFKLDGSDPGEWLEQVKPAVRELADFETRPLQQIARDNQLGIARPAFDPQAALGGGNETRLSKDTYEFVRANKLYNLDGQNDLSKQGRLTISFPARSKEIKAQWREISEAQKPRYHWTSLKAPDGKTRIYGLTALHITTKDLPNWFWATFEHVDNATRPGNEAWKLESRDTFACTIAPFNCNLAPKGIGLEGTKWENYRLRGTQIEFIDSRGTTTLLANSEPEEGFQATSSCMTCHSRSTIGPKGNDRLDIFKSDGTSFNGAPDPGWFIIRDANSKQTGRYAQLDFVWSLFRAQPKK
jgi:hypothetical protein